MHSAISVASCTWLIISPASPGSAGWPCGQPPSSQPPPGLAFSPPEAGGPSHLLRELFLNPPGHVLMVLKLQACLLLQCLPLLSPSLPLLLSLSLLPHRGFSSLPCLPTVATPDASAASPPTPGLSSTAPPSMVPVSFQCLCNSRFLKQSCRTHGFFSG